MIYKTGQWLNVAKDMKNLQDGLQTSQDNMKRILPNKFVNGIRGEIVKNKIRPKDNKKVSATDYATAVSSDKDGNEVTVGIERARKIKGFDIGQFALDSEYGVNGTQWLGVWRRYADRFENTIDSQAGIEMSRIGLA